jgi:hypothetical protein
MMTLTDSIIRMAHLAKDDLAGVKTEVPLGQLSQSFCCQGQLSERTDSLSLLQGLYPGVVPCHMAVGRGCRRHNGLQSDGVLVGRDWVVLFHYNAVASLLVALLTVDH